MAEDGALGQAGPSHALSNDSGVCICSRPHDLYLNQTSGPLTIPGYALGKALRQIDAAKACMVMIMQ